MSEDRLRNALDPFLEPEGDCPSPAAIHRFATGEAADEERATVDAHLLTCAACMDKWRETRSLLQALAQAPAVPTEAAAGAPAPPRPRWAWFPVPALTAVAATLALAGGWVLLQWRGLQREHARLTASHTRLIQEQTQVQVANLLDLTPESLELRSADTPALDTGAGATWVLVLNTLDDLPAAVQVSIQDEQETTIWSQAYSAAPPSPLSLLVPADLFTPGPYHVVIRSQATDRILDRFPFQTR